MKLGAIFNVWADSVELLSFAIKAMPADFIIVIASLESNKGEVIQGYMHGPEYFPDQPLKYVVRYFKPDLKKSAAENETAKRNLGVAVAKEINCSHFIMCDSDEFYNHEEFEIEKWRINRYLLNGLVHPIKVYVGKPTLWCEDHTLVPGIQKLYPDTQLGNFKNYPFAYDAQGHAHIDPTRRTNQTTGIEMSPFYMHHMSYVRRDIDLKIRNSSANLRRSEAAIKRDITNAAPGYMSELYHRELKECENLFNITI